MTILSIIAFTVGILGLLFGLRCYLELLRWARQCQRARIAVSFKRKVKLQAPLVEWLLWCNQLDKDKDSTGRVIYQMGGTTVAILKAVKPPKRRWSHNRSAKTGDWSAKDESK